MWRQKNRVKVRAVCREWRKTAAGIAATRRSRASKYKKIWQMLFDFKDNPCVDCGLQLIPELMDIDHVSTSRIHKFKTSYSIGRLAEELKGCEVRCPICHRIRHLKDRLK